MLAHGREQPSGSSDAADAASCNVLCDRAWPAWQGGAPQRGA
jgi:hypothetical protein